ncbi:MAG: hypothetical protein GXZ02_07325 [Clostridiales bacterium]|nr:hypothetical protein [Clostridiales bacterium]
MKKLISVLAVLLVCAVFITAFTGCMANPEKQIIGKWKDSAGIIGYEFFEDGTVKFSVLIGNVNGTYTMDKKEETVTLTGTIPVINKSISETYKYLIEENKLTLTDLSTGNAATYIRESVSTTAK